MSPRLRILPQLNILPFYALLVTCTIYLLNLQQSCNERDFIIPGGNYGPLIPAGITGMAS